MFWLVKLGIYFIGTQTVHIQADSYLFSGAIEENERNFMATKAFHQKYKGSLNSLSLLKSSTFRKFFRQFTCTYCNDLISGYVCNEGIYLYMKSLIYDFFSLKRIIFSCEFICCQRF